MYVVIAAITFIVAMLFIHLTDDFESSESFDVRVGVTLMAAVFSAFWPIFLGVATLVGSAYGLFCLTKFLADGIKRVIESKRSAHN